MTDTILETNDLSYSYPDGTKALNNVTLRIKRGKTTAILGGNGAGKTTLFLNFNGILKPTAGNILFNGMPLDYSKKGLADLRRGVGIVFQDPDSQLFSASVYQDVSFGPSNLKLPEKEIRERVQDSLIRTGIYELKDRPTHSLSFGQKKRAAIAGVLAMKPEVIVLDEPTAGLDPKGIGEIMRLLKEMKEQMGITVIIATHDIDLVPLFCDEVHVMEKGFVILTGTPDQVFTKPKVLRGVHLRLPRIAHLMEILHEKDGYDYENSVATISQARKVIKKWRESGMKER